MRDNVIPFPAKPAPRHPYPEDAARLIDAAADQLAHVIGWLDQAEDILDANGWPRTARLPRHRDKFKNLDGPKIA
jgi:hypothetical protein